MGKEGAIFVLFFDSMSTAMILAFAGLGATEIILIIVVIVLFFGAKRIPGLARGLGQSVSEFKKGKNEGPDKEEPLTK